MNGFDSLPITPSEILVPKPGADTQKWACVACDQFTSEPEYWREVETLVADSPSTYNIILPETYLELDKDDASGISAATKERVKRIQDVTRTLAQSSDVLERVNGFILVERSFAPTKDGGNLPSRIGLVAAVDLESYDFAQGSTSTIRATEGTIVERLPPRAVIRKNAALECPHIILLASDKDELLIEPIYKKRDALHKVYDSDLMMNGGHVTGYAVTSDDDIANVKNAMKALCEKSEISLAVGDGNHSLAAAKTVWDEVKQGLSDTERAGHPLRYALAEICNIYNEGIEFEPIHRVVYGAAYSSLMLDFFAWLRSHGAKPCVHIEDAADCVASPDAQTLVCVGVNGSYTLTIENAPCKLPVGTLQRFLDEYVMNNNVTIDYIHGGDTLRRLASEPNRAGFILPSVSKDLLFKAIEADGSLPRKTFSIGRATDKRYYLECRRIG